MSKQNSLNQSGEITPDLPAAGAVTTTEHTHQIIINDASGNSLNISALMADLDIQGQINDGNDAVGNSTNISALGVHLDINNPSSGQGQIKVNKSAAINFLSDFLIKQFEIIANANCDLEGQLNVGANGELNLLGNKFMIINSVKLGGNSSLHIYNSLVKIAKLAMAQYSKIVVHDEDDNTETYLCNNNVEFTFLEGKRGINDIAKMLMYNPDMASPTIELSGNDSLLEESPE